MKEGIIQIYVMNHILLPKFLNDNFVVICIYIYYYI